MEERAKARRATEDGGGHRRSGAPPKYRVPLFSSQTFKGGQPPARSFKSPSRIPRKRRPTRSREEGESHQLRHEVKVHKGALRVPPGTLPTFRPFPAKSSPISDTTGLSLRSDICPVDGTNSSSMCQEEERSSAVTGRPPAGTSNGVAQETCSSLPSKRNGAQGGAHSHPPDEGHHYCHLQEEHHARVLYAVDVRDGLPASGSLCFSFAGDSSAEASVPTILLPPLSNELLEVRQGWDASMPQGSGHPFEFGEVGEEDVKEVGAPVLGKVGDSHTKALHAPLDPSLSGSRSGEELLSGTDLHPDAAFSRPRQGHHFPIPGELSQLLGGAGAGLYESVPDEGTGDEWYLGMSSSSDPTVIFTGGAPKPPRKKSFHPLARVAANDIRLEALMQAVDVTPDFYKSEFFKPQEWQAAIDAFCLGTAPLPTTTTTQPREDPTTVSRGFSEEDIKVLSHVIDFEPAVGTPHTKSAPVPLSIFKVDKSDGCSARLVADCRALNRGFQRPPPMGLPPLDHILKILKKYEKYASVDAMSYFFQFPLSSFINASVRVGHGWRGGFKKGKFSRLIMGLSWAPFVAQQTSWGLAALIKARWHACGVAGEIIPWVDNFLLFSNHIPQALAITREVMLEFNVVLKEDVEEELMLGFEVRHTNRGNEVAIRENWAAKAQTLITVLQTSLSEGEGHPYEQPILMFQQVAGYLLWANQVARIPLCVTPALLDNLRRVGRGEPIQKEALIEEIPKWADFFPRSTFNSQVEASMDAVWSDASDEVIAYTIPVSAPRRSLRVQSLAAPKEVHIFYKELAGVALAILAWSRRGEGKTCVFCDNMAVAAGIAKGHFKSQGANALLEKIIHSIGGVIWVPSRFQLADRQTRGSTEAVSLYKADASFFRPLRSAFSVWGRGGGSVLATQASAAIP